jgi:hypothetical protein
MAFSISPNLPANVVEIGNELSQARLDAINNGSSPTSANPFMTSSAVSTTYAAKASPTFTGIVTIPAGASISGYLTTSSAASTYQTISGMSSYATQSYVTTQGYLTDAPSNGSEYVRKNGAWSVATGGGGGGISDAPSDGSMYARLNAGWTSFTIPTVPPASVTNIDLTGNFNGYSMGSGYYSFKYDSTANTLRMQDGVGSGITISATGITFSDATTLTTAPTGGGSAKTVNQQTSNWTLNAGDTNNIVYFNGVMATLTIQDDASYSFPVGTHIMVATYNCSIGVIAQDTMTPAPVIYGSTTLPTTGITHFIKLASNLWIID